MPYYQFDEKNNVIGIFANPQSFETTYIEKYLELYEPYTDHRRREYPSSGDLADAIYWQAKGDSSKMNEYIAKCDAIKLKYPKE